ncbi:MAG TPA: hypothetical protein VGO37_06080 [Steroidobacteraceae bacterium]|jgi:hypothetical protein|nr:hypothetical protein [Steroidobacteraceae bacterium]
MSEIESEPESPETGTTDPVDMPLLPRSKGVKSTAGPKLTVLPPPKAPPRHPVLASATDVKRELGKIYRQSKFGLMPLETACKLTYMLTSIVKIIDSSDIERRLKALEQEEDRHEHR